MVAKERNQKVLKKVKRERAKKPPKNKVYNILVNIMQNDIDIFLYI
jgi:hypothetical protein